MTHHNHTQPGFALLMTLLVVTVVVSITLTVIELTIKQLNLSVTAKDSEIAFHAANAGMECVRYARRLASTSLETKVNNVRINCFNVTNQNLRLQSDSLNRGSADEDWVSYYQAEVSWLTGDRCSVIDMVLINVPTTETSPVVIGNLDSIFSSFSDSDTKNCDPGAKCTIAEVVGYNKNCTNINSPGTVRREILLEF